MLSEEEREEMLKDARNYARRQHVRAEIEKHDQANSFDEYISFLNSVQKIFLPFTNYDQPTQTKFNKL